MKLGMIGLGRMGADMVRRLIRGGHELVVYDIDAKAVESLAAEGATGAHSLDEFVKALEEPRVVWLMIPAGLTGRVADDVASRLSTGDVLIDGGNSYYRDDVDRAQRFSARGLHYLDVGVSGGIWGLRQGYCLMIGGEAELVHRLEPIFQTLAPGVEAAKRTAGKTGEPSPQEHGYLHCGPSGAGHFVKMIHNGIEYGMMAAYAEGMAILRRANIGRADRTHDAETAPLATPQYYQYDIDTAAVAEVWRRGSVVQSWLLDLTANALHEDPDLEQFGGRVSDSGEGRWTALAAVEEGVPAHVITAALYERFTSQGNADFGSKVLSAMRKQFGGHNEKTS